MSSAAGPPPEDAGQSSAPPGTPPVKSQKQMTKAERREIQERQRAAKAEKAAQNQSKNPGKSSNKPAQTSKESAPAPRKVSKPAEAAPRGAQGAAGQSKDTKTGGEDKPAHTRGLRIFSHFGLPKPTSHKGEVHPAIVRLGLQFSEFKITGANARCIATLTSFKTVIQDYVTPPNNTLSRHLMTYLSPQISYLVNVRPMSVTMGNAIRQLKLDISGTDIDLPEQDAKDALCGKIDTYIRDRIIAADQVIEETAGNKIKDGDAILTYARSSVVEKVLLAAYADGKEFTVTVVDSRPMLEGKKLLKVLSSAGIQCTYLLLPAVGSVITEISMVLVGAHSLHSNGAVFSRAGTALVAMMAKQHSVPVVVCCETYKFSETVQLDSFARNELAPLELFKSFPRNNEEDSSSLGDRPNLQILNPLYDLTPPSSITAVVTEVGVIPPSSISSIPLALGRTIL
ncbi:IF-2B-domain-containing protein [Heliocybe sulcata]|uniref:Translation initiation factor eIF2B subunit delta n=1 Tax=Heliocybe sulcata TaxID=5364 RepID=A0A5C3NI48_9AGAM|nr:IF-2B-domain-containing protein [Heliocybe sulcata]